MVMAKIKVYSYKKCSTCVKALKYLDKKKVAYETVDITENPPSAMELKAMLSSYDGELKRLFNTSGVAYRELNIKDKMKTMTESEAIKLLSKNGRLVKRPFLLNNTKGLIGFKEAEWKKVF